MTLYRDESIKPGSYYCDEMFYFQLVISICFVGRSGTLTIIVPKSLVCEKKEFTLSRHIYFSVLVPVHKNG